MKCKSTLLGFTFSAAFLLIPILMLAQHGNDRETEVQKAVRKAKHEGRMTAEISLPMAEYATIVSFKQSVAETHPLIVRVIAQQSALDEHFEKPWTWYKLRIVSNLCGRKLQRGPMPKEVPQQLLPIGNNETVIRVGGGEVLADGVRVYSTANSFPKLLVGHTYIVFADYMWRLSKTHNYVLSVPYGPDGVFRITSEQRFRPLSRRSNKIYVELKKFEGNVPELANQFHSYCEQQ